MDSKTQQTWTVQRYTCQPCLVLEAEQDNDSEQAKNSGRRQRGLKYAVKRTTQ